MKTGSITYNGKNSLELGVFTTGSGSFDAAELDVDKYEVAGRNGDVIIPNNRYKNIEVIYPAFIPKQFGDKVQSVRNWLRSAKVYSRLEDTYDMDHFRLGLASGVQSFEPVNRNDGANFEMTFDCKPQRFLKAGETPETVEVEEKSASGEIASFETDYVVPMTSAEVSLSPQQDLNGYDSPWPGGGGKNLVPSFITQNTTGAGLTLTLNDDGSVKIAGTANNNSAVIIGQRYVSISLPAGTYTFSNGISDNNNKVYCQAVSADHVWFSRTGSDTFTLTQATTITRLDIGINAANGESINVVVKPQLEKGSVATAWTPYSNICPITGHTGATLYRTGKNLASISMESYNASQIISNLFALKKGTYTISFDYEGTPTYGVYLREGRQVASSIKAVYNVNNITFTLNRDYDNLCLSVYSANGIAPTELSNIMVALGSSASSYEPYEGTTYSVTFTDQGTVYGGTFDFVSGDGQSKMASVDLGTLTYTYMSLSGGRNAFVAKINGIKPHASNAVPINAISSGYKAVSYNASWTNGDMSYTRNATGADDKQEVTFINNSYTDAAAFKTAMSGVQLVYELQAPVTIDLSTTEVQTLLGLNNVWSSDGTVEINYADPFNVDNPTYYASRPLFEITNPAQNDVLNVNGKTITFLSSYTGTVTIDCETMDCYAGYSNMNYLIEATDFPVLVPGTNIVTWTGAGECTMTPRWWEL